MNENNDQSRSDQSATPESDQRAGEMAVTRHTPGPWAWFGNTKNHEIHLATERGGRVFVMQFARYGMASAQPRFQVGRRMVNAHELVRYERDYRKDIAYIDHPDAHLIAAAPDLLAALMAVIDWQNIDHEADCPSDDTCTCALVKQVNAAIAKAEGR